MCKLAWLNMQFNKAEQALWIVGLLIDASAHKTNLNFQFQIQGGTSVTRSLAAFCVSSCMHEWDIYVCQSAGVYKSVQDYFRGVRQNSES